MFRILKKSKISKARLGLIKTPHGNLETPIFMPDATRGVLKLISAGELKELGLECLVANTLHLFLHPGIKLIKQARGLNNFMNWPGAVLTDSGGYQVYSLIHKNYGRITDEAAFFKSPLNGEELKLAPEQSVKIQFGLGADIMVCLDDCPPNDFSADKIEAAVKRTIKWAKRCRGEYDKQIKAFKNKKYRPLLFAVIQGGNNLKLREACAAELVKIGFDGYGFGARHTDGAGNFFSRTLKHTVEQIPENKLRFGLGIGRPEDIIRSIKLGWDMFDCVIPTREGRHGRLFLRKRISNSQFPISNKNTKKFYETVNITNAKFARDFSPINPESQLGDLRTYSKAYLNYLFKIGEPLGARLASLNNLEFYLKMIGEVKGLIKNDKF